jgi:hypothetical protein
MKIRTLATAGVFVVSLMSLSVDSALAQGKGHDQKPVKHAKPVKYDKPAKYDKPVTHVKHEPAKPAKYAKPAKPAKPRVVAVPVFVAHDRDVITRYYAALPPGLAKRNGNLPPGLEKQLQRNGVLPPGLRARLRPLPIDLERQLEPLPYGYRRGILDQHLVVYRTGTYRIGDTILYVLR